MNKLNQQELKMLQKGIREEWPVFVSMRGRRMRRKRYWIYTEWVILLMRSVNM